MPVSLCGVCWNNYLGTISSSPCYSPEDWLLIEFIIKSVAENGKVWRPLDDMPIDGPELCGLEQVNFIHNIHGCFTGNGVQSHARGATMTNMGKTAEITNNGWFYFQALVSVRRLNDFLNNDELDPNVFSGKCTGTASPCTLKYSLSSSNMIHSNRCGSISYPSPLCAKKLCFWRIITVTSYWARWRLK